MHPDEIERFKSLMIPVFAAESESGGRALMNATFGRDARISDVRMAVPAEFLRRFARVMAVRMPDQPTDYELLLVLGSVKEDARVHVLVRLSSGGKTQVMDRLEVVSLMPFEDGWKLTLFPKLEEAVAAMDRRGSGAHPASRLAPRPEAVAPPLRPAGPTAQSSELEKPAAVAPRARTLQ